MRSTEYRDPRELRQLTTGHECSDELRASELRVTSRIWDPRLEVLHGNGDTVARGNHHGNGASDQEEEKTFEDSGELA